MPAETMSPLDLVDFKYVFCPTVGHETRLTRAYTRYPTGSESEKTLVSCWWDDKCGVQTVKDGKVVHDFSKCPFSKKVHFLE